MNDFETVKQVLNQYKGLDSWENILTKEIAFERKLINSLVLSSDHFDRHQEEVLLRLDKKLRVWERDLVDISNRKRRIYDLISDVPGIEGEILFRHYVKYQTMEDISETVFFSLRYVVKIHRKALQIVQQRLDQDDSLDTISTVWDKSSPRD